MSKARLLKTAAALATAATAIGGGVAIASKHKEYSAAQAGLASTLPVLFLASDHARQAAQYRATGFLAERLKDTGYKAYLIEGIDDAATLPEKMNDLDEMARGYHTLYTNFPGMKAWVARKDQIPTLDFVDTTYQHLMAQGIPAHYAIDVADMLCRADAFGPDRRKMFETLQQLGFGYRNMDNDSTGKSTFSSGNREDKLHRSVRASLEDGQPPIVSVGVSHLDSTLREPTAGPGIDGRLAKDGIPFATVHIYDGKTVPTDPEEAALRTGKAGICAIDINGKTQDRVWGELKGVIDAARPKPESFPNWLARKAVNQLTSMGTNVRGR